jgi:hypothetical protein
MFVHRTAVLALALAGALSAGAALANERTLPEACQADASSLCPGMAPGDGKLRKCMKEHRDKVSEGCRSAIRQAKKAEHAASGGHAASGAHAGGHAGGKAGGDGEGPDED